ncbi:uncharacterized protein LOC109722067 [Ananas comosus]|uniref:Uncharacterized protein LOC109722067 n=1 Tax=Ananas comosus TaxID=4615 RepID=A0A6P5GHN5_ANACO|nr:uncharacterized protein LOC109722067 [Ananas comosus]XP_020105536.1 uncharacterized protein LOC109722067 [Ananas comosus]XP_020105537.1 uncharacterized protein LOC109722067 [Ananas comosus]XP_020105538.1 uncharacterized protein LOC109722067 [Ananas comosus]
MSCQLLSYPLASMFWNNRTHRKSRPCCSVSNSKQSSLLVKTDGNGRVLSESKNLDTGSPSSAAAALISGPVLSLPYTVGVIGGVSAALTLAFLEKLVAWSSQESQESLPFIVCNDPTLTREYVNASSRDNNGQTDYTSIVRSLRRKRVFLERSGARCIVMPCHASHRWHEEISNDCSVPFLHVGDCVAKELKAADLKPIEAGSNVRIGLIATDYPLTASFYQEKLQNEGFEVVYPDKATMEHIVVPAVSAFRRKDMEGARTLSRIALQVLLVRAVNTIVLASDDITRILPRDDPLLEKCIDPMDILARETIAWAKSLEGNDPNVVE